MHAGRRVALVVPALDEEASIGSVMRAFRAHPTPDLVLVVDNGSRDATAERARDAGARVAREPIAGYGAALRTGIELALADGAEIVVLTEADGTFDAGDLEALLAPLDEADLVLGSRAARLPRLQRWGNRLVAGLLVALWTPRSAPLTDVGCTYRALRAEAWRRMPVERAPRGPEFSPWMIAAAFRSGLAVREIAVSYGSRRAGRSRHSGSAYALTRTALRMLGTIRRQRLGPV